MVSLVKTNGFMRYENTGWQDNGLREGAGKSAERVMGSVDLPRNEHLDGRYVPYAASIKLAKEHQPWEDPVMPSPVFAKKLREAALSSMPRLPQELHRNLKFYTSVGSPLDRYHGIDAFLEFEVTGKDPIRITLDITMKPGKDAWKADILFSVGQVDVETFAQDISVGKFDDIIGRVAKTVASLIFNRLTGRPTEKTFIPEKEERTTL